MFKLNSDFLAGSVIGFGAGLATASLKGEGSFRDLSKNAMKMAMKTLEAAKGQLAEWKEDFEDVAAEAKAEVKDAEQRATQKEPRATKKVPARA